MEDASERQSIRPKDDVSSEVSSCKPKVATVGVDVATSFRENSLKPFPARGVDMST